MGNNCTLPDYRTTVNFTVTHDPICKNVIYSTMENALQQSMETSYGRTNWSTGYAVKSCPINNKVYTTRYLTCAGDAAACALARASVAANMTEARVLAAIKETECPRLTFWGVSFVLPEERSACQRGKNAELFVKPLSASTCATCFEEKDECITSLFTVERAGIVPLLECVPSDGFCEVDWTLFIVMVVGVGVGVILLCCIGVCCYCRRKDDSRRVRVVRRNDEMDGDDENQRLVL